MLTKQVVVIVNCPSELYLNALVQHKDWTEYFEKSKTHEVICVVHITPHEIMQKTEYKEFMGEFGSKCHVSVNFDNLFD